MDQDTVVNEQIDSGERLIEALSAEGFNVGVGFWAKPTEEGKWFLYLASDLVDSDGPAVAYRLVHDVMRKTPDLWIDPLEVKVLGLKDSLALDAMNVTRPKVPDSPFAVRTPKPFQGMTRFGGATLGGVSIDGAYIYPPSATNVGT